MRELLGMQFMQLALIAAAVTGETTSAISGRESRPIPEKPPLARPVSMTAGTMAAKKTRSKGMAGGLRRGAGTGKGDGRKS